MHDEPSKPLGKTLREVFSEEEKQKPDPAALVQARSLDDIGRGRGLGFDRLWIDEARDVSPIAWETLTGGRRAGMTPVNWVEEADRVIARMEADEERLIADIGKLTQEPTSNPQGAPWPVPKPAPPSGEGASSLDAETRRRLAQMQVPRLYRGDGPPPTDLPPAQVVGGGVEPSLPVGTVLWRDDARLALAYVIQLLELLDTRTLVRPVLPPADINPDECTWGKCLRITKEYLAEAVRVVREMPLAVEQVVKATEKVQAEKTVPEQAAETEQAFADVAPKVAQTFRREPLSPPPSAVAIQWVADARYIRDQLGLRPFVRDFLIYAGKLKDCPHDDC